MLLHTIQSTNVHSYCIDKQGELLRQEKARQPQFRVPGHPERLQNLSLNDIIYRCLQRAPAAFVVPDPDTGAPVNLLEAYQDLDRVSSSSTSHGSYCSRVGVCAVALCAVTAAVRKSSQ
jgi:hypothetical protein